MSEKSIRPGDSYSGTLSGSNLSPGDHNLCKQEAGKHLRKSACKDQHGAGEDSNPASLPSLASLCLEALCAVGLGGQN